MDCRSILRGLDKINTDPLNILIDSASFNELLEKNEQLAISILNYNINKNVAFIRTPMETKFDLLKYIIEFDIIDNENVEIVKNNHTTSFKIAYNLNNIRKIVKVIFNKDTYTDDEFNRVLWVFVNARLITSCKYSLMITNDDKILKKRLLIESFFPGCPLNIMSLEEASIFIDLWLKSYEIYQIAYYYTCDKGLWYWYSMRSKLPHYHVGSEVINGLGMRFVYSLTALDEMGIQYYQGANNNTKENTQYHFNYLITLITGIFDNLALETDAKLGINYPDIIRISLHNYSGKDFLIEVRNKDANIRNHINKYVKFISLIYLFRELVIHREGLKNAVLEVNEDIHWKTTVIRISEDVKERLKACGDKPSTYDPFTEWGFYQLQNDYFIIPYIFSMQVMKKLIEFTDEYLSLLGNSSFIQQEKAKNSDFGKGLTTFEINKIGF